MSTLAAGQGLARRGYPVLPVWYTDRGGACACGAPEGSCKPGKHPLGPLVPHGVKDATTNPDIIKRWFRRAPQANLGLACGGPQRLLVIDVDPDTGGTASLAALEHDHGSLPATVETVTPRGGRHVYLNVPDGRPLPRNSAGDLGPGVDIRSENGLVVVPPSRIGARSYAWSVQHGGDRIATAPAWLLDRLAPTPAPPRQAWQGPRPTLGSHQRADDKYVLRALEVELCRTAQAAEGQRNAQLNTSGYSLFRFVADGRLDRNIIERGLLDAARHAGLSETESRATIQSAAKARGLP